MNTKIIALTLAAATAFAFTPKPALAGDKETALIGGLIGGIVLGTVLANADVDTHVVFAGHGHYRDRDRDDGFWKRVETRVWIPGYWVTERRHGRTHRFYVAGHYEIRTDRVWVSYDRHDRHDRRDRGYGYDRRDRHYRR